jgi:hypothetical protein
MDWTPLGPAKAGFSIGARAGLCTRLLRADLDNFRRSAPCKSRQSSTSKGFSFAIVPLRTAEASDTASLRLGIGRPFTALPIAASPCAAVIHEILISLYALELHFGHLRVCCNSDAA